MALGIYLHIPFCLSKCSYCDFFSVIGKEEAMPTYRDALIDEIEMHADDELRIDTVFFGGGTPSYVPTGDLDAIIQALRRSFSVADDAEITCETNPETVDTAKLRRLLEVGINRLSLGVQSFHNSELQQMGRAHDSVRAHDAFRSAREAGFTNISMDLISALPGMSMDSWLDNLSQLLAAGPEHLSAYTLEYHPGTRFERERTLGLLKPAQEKLEGDMFLETIRRLRDAGYEHYEISNFAQPGYRCRHNLKYWRHEPYLAFGTSAHGFDGRFRYWNHRSLERYLEDVQAGRRPEASREELNAEQLELERLMLGLRTDEGIPWPFPNLPADVPEDLVLREADRIRLSDRGFVLYDSVCAALARAR